MADIEFTNDEKQQMVSKLKSYFEDELQQEIGSFDAEFLIEFFAKELGNYFYNQGLQDAQVILSRKVEEIADAIYEIEKPVSVSR